MNKAWLCLVGLILFSSSFQIVMSSSDSASYDRMAHVNRDHTIDVNDLNQLGRAYGSNMVLPSEPGKTVVTVLSFDREPPEVENARVAIIDPEVCGDAVNVTYTNSSGIAAFGLNPSKNYTAIAWSGSAYNYANFTTDALGEDSLLICLGEPQLPPICCLPRGWIVFTFLDNETGMVCPEPLSLNVFNMKPDLSTGTLEWLYEPLWNYYTRIGVNVVPPDIAATAASCGQWAILLDDYPNARGSRLFSADEDGCPSVVVYVIPPP